MVIIVAAVVILLALAGAAVVMLLVAGLKVLVVVYRSKNNDSSGPSTHHLRPGIPLIMTPSLFTYIVPLRSVRTKPRVTVAVLTLPPLQPAHTSSVCVKKLVNREIGSIGSIESIESIDCTESIDDPIGWECC